MNSNRELAENGQKSHRQLAEIALERYALAGAGLTLISDSDSALYKVSLPAGGAEVYHPYLGRISGQQLVLRIEDAAMRIASTYSELALLAALLRDTDLALPEPVPSSGGELVPEIWVEGMGSPRQCVLFRWTQTDDSTPNSLDFFCLSRSLYELSSMDDAKLLNMQG